MKNFTDKQKLKKFSPNKTSFTTNVNRTSLGRKGHNQKQENYGRKQFISKGKYTVMVGNYPHTKLVEILKDKNSNITRIYNKQLKDTKNNQM